MTLIECCIVLWIITIEARLWIHQAEIEALTDCIRLLRERLEAKL